jgi:hypothetical protein
MLPIEGCLRHTGQTQGKGGQVDSLSVGGNQQNSHMFVDGYPFTVNRRLLQVARRTLIISTPLECTVVRVPRTFFLLSTLAP